MLRLPGSLAAHGLRAGLALATLCTVLAGCTGAPHQQPVQGRPQGQPSRPASASSRTVDPNVQLCGRYAEAARGARTPLDAMRTEAVLLPFIDLIELSTQQVAQQAALAPDPAVAGAMREVASAIEDLDAQGHAKLPPGTNAADTTVWLDPARLNRALDTADRACAGHLAPTR